MSAPDPLSGGSNLPGFFPSGSNSKDRYANPFYGVPLQFLPQNMDQMLWWANHFLFRFPFYRTVLSRVANYFITSLKIECDDADAKRKYEELFADMEWKQVLGMTGLNLLAYGNVFATITQGFERFLVCGSCKRISNIEKVRDYEFDKQCAYTCVCRGCKKKSKHTVVDKPSKDLKKVHVTFWNPRHVIVRFEETTSDAEYYWNIPQEYINKVTAPNNKFYSKKTPRAIYDAILEKKPLAFNTKNFVHLKVPTPVGLSTYPEGKAVPFCIYMFDDFFMLKVLERYNQALMFEDIVPFRVFAMADAASNPQQNNILAQNGAQWQAAIQRMIQERRLDPGSYHMFPFTLNYQQLGADGKQLAPTELTQSVITNLLNALNIPQELYTMTLATQAMGPALRLFENSWSFMIDVYNQMLNQWADVISKINGLPKAKVNLMPVTLSDDIERKSIIGQLVSANAIARSELLNMYGFDYREQVRKKMEEDRTLKELQQEEATKEQLRQMAQSGPQGTQGGGGSTPQDVLENAQQIAQQLFPLDPHERRAKLQEIKASDQTLYSAVKQALEEMTNEARSGGVDQAKQQAKQQ